MKTLQKREQWLLIILLSSVLISAYMLIRIQPQRQQLITLKTDKTRVEKKLNKERRSEKSKGSVEAIQKEVNTLQENIDSAGTTLAGYQQAFIDLQKHEMRADLKAKITRLIEDQNMIILSIEETSKSLDKLIDTSSQGTQEIKRPMISLKLTGNFNQLNRFIQQLEGLQNSVVITRLSLIIERQANLRAPYQLMMALTLAL